MPTAIEATRTMREPTCVELTDKDLDNVVGGTRTSAGNNASGTLFLAFTFKL